MILIEEKSSQWKGGWEYLTPARIKTLRVDFREDSVDFG